MGRVFARLRVVSFRGFGRAILDSGGGSGIPEVTPMGRRLLIARLLIEHASQLQHFRSVADRPGLPAVIDEMFEEFEQSGKSVDDLDFLIADLEASDPSSGLVRKMRDLRLLWPLYQEMLGSARLDPARREAKVIESMTHSPLLKDAHLFVDGFDSFRPNECRLIAAAARWTSDTRVSLAIPSNRRASMLLDRFPVDDDPIRRLLLTYRRLGRAALESGLSIDPPDICESDAIGVAPGIDAIRRHLLSPIGESLSQSTSPSSITANSTDPGVEFIEAPTIHDEVDAAARRVRDLARSGLRFREIAILARSLEPYAHVIERSFQLHGIPHFVDRVRPASHHPVVQVVYALLRLRAGELDGSELLALLKSGLVETDDDAIDALEEYVSAHDLDGRDWLDERAWSIEAPPLGEDMTEAERATRYIDIDRINRVRRDLIRHISPLLEQKSPKSVADQVRMLHDVIITLGVRQRLSEWIRQAEGEASAIHRQVWTDLIESLDQFVDVLGETPLDARAFADLLRSGLSGFSLAIAPPTLDQMIVGSFDRTRLGHVRAVVILGMSDGLLPVRHESQTVLRDDERRALADRSWDIAPDNRQRLMDELSLFAAASSMPDQRLILTRHTSDADGKPLPVSSFLRTVLRCVPNLTSIEVDPSQPESVGHVNQIVQHVLSDRSTSPSNVTEKFLFELDRRPDWRPWVDRIANIRSYANQASLSKDLSTIVGEELRGSVSRLESFAACPFKHFSSYTLRLREQHNAELSPMMLGTIYHRAMESVVSKAIDARRRLQEVPIDALLQSATSDFHRDIDRHIHLSPGRRAYVERMIVEDVTDVLNRQQRFLAAGQFAPVHVELSFGREEGDLGPLHLITPAGRRVALSGQIDRVDMLSSQGAHYATVVDYKSTPRKFKPDEVILGTGLQLLTYLLIMREKGQQLFGHPVSMVAALYVGISRKLLSEANPNDVPTVESDEYWSNTELRPRGIVDAAYLDLINSSQTTQWITGGIPKDGSHIKQDVVAAHLLDQLLDFARQTISTLADRIFAGDIAVSPYRRGTYTPCQHCPFRPVCRFDPLINRYRNVEPLSGELAIKRMLDELNPPAREIEK